MKERRITHVALVITLYHSIYVHLLCICSKDYRLNPPCYFVAADTHHFSLRPTRTGAGGGAKQQRPSSFVIFRRDDNFNLKFQPPPSSTAHASSASGGREPLTGGSDADPDTTSLSGVRYGSVLSGIDALYPPSGKCVSGRGYFDQIGRDPYYFPDVHFLQNRFGHISRRASN